MTNLQFRFAVHAYLQPLMNFSSSQYVSASCKCRSSSRWADRSKVSIEACKIPTAMFIAASMVPWRWYKSGMSVSTWPWAYIEFQISYSLPLARDHRLECLPAPFVLTICHSC